VSSERDELIEMNKARGGWRRYVLSWIRSAIEIGGWLGWDVDLTGTPPFVLLEHTRDKSKTQTESESILREFDDLATGLFGFRDWTSSGLPFVNNEEKYWSGWWFQFREDAKNFQERYGGKGTWQPNFSEWERECNLRRDKDGI
jgi:hypothetical protein